MNSSARNEKLRKRAVKGAQQKETNRHNIKKKGKGEKGGGDFDMITKGENIR